MSDTSAPLPFHIPISEAGQIEHYVPEEWCKPSEGKHLFLATYEVQGLPEASLTRPCVCTLTDVRVVFFRGIVSYRGKVHVTGMWMEADHTLRIADSDPEVVQSAPGIFSVYVSPFASISGSSTGELIAETNIRVARSLLASFQGRNISYKKVAVNTYDCSSHGLASWTDAIPLPFSFPTPDLTWRGIEPTLIAERARVRLDGPSRNRIDLSLIWLDEAMDAIGVDAFVKFWLAIEVLTMSTSNVRPVIERLGRIYRLSASQTARRFEVGRLFGLRSRILHKGLKPPIEGPLLRFCELLHHDLLRDVLGLVPEHRAGSFLTDSGFDLHSCLTSLLTAF